MATVTLADDWIHSVLSLATSPDSQRQCDINDSDVPPYRLQAATSKQCCERKKTKKKQEPSIRHDKKKGRKKPLH